MGKVEIIVISAAIAIFALRIYQKYIKKEKSKPGTGIKSSPGTVFSSFSEDDDYEPYSKK